MKKILEKISQKKIEINWNRNPIKMELFLSFLTVEVKRSTNFSGQTTGWTELVGDDNLVILGGKVKGTEYLDSLKYKTNLDNKYNNCVNPFYLFDILNDDGKNFFIEYYKDDIKECLEKSEEVTKEIALKLEEAKTKHSENKLFWEKIGFINE